MLPSSSGTLWFLTKSKLHQQQQQLSSSIYKNKLKLNVITLKKKTKLHVNCIQYCILMSWYAYTY